MDGPEYRVGDRRPLASRDLAITQSVARWLAGSGATPNAISVAGMVSGLLAGAILFATSRVEHSVWALWLAAALFIQLRLLANLFDGMVAVHTGKASPVGELFNEVPDRVSDAATLVGLGYAVGSLPWLGWAAACVAVFTAYLRAMGKVAGAHQEFCGPMAKQQRMALATGAAVICAFLPQATSWRVPAIALGIIVAGAIATSIRRLTRIAAAHSLR